MKKADIPDMRTFFTLCLFLCLALGCNDRGGSIFFDPELTILEEKLVGTWVLENEVVKETVTYNEDLSFEGSKDGLTFSGNYALDNDSLLVLNRAVVLKGEHHPLQIKYGLISLEDAELRIRSIGWRDGLLYRRSQ
ncbi:MAG: hypothetical protein A2350_05415 [Candidatus Raymondbacteria bacterium RifOxyB12_full_50_8]|uniref:Lipocalin-like domain-containing protein n=1 Tax=Candidatus Raymondbacteria bacterium RIFOXYD12_FULL_49_13 TaxID=1817890 RepID=A0A1F7FHD1_UNCRA|nr:MAG: hypothetical protein A2248_05115 [Candidatus Raymondbacteria bacterium RIFOXYA2_FULL_49_16]OGJ99284.1 MAG: hypothetical protein A2350_05415 [Candidatus Raymondbacteria bacterium RifOxyB12_full_50_8]OGK05876.1 MAG: hypothetical protein A2519_04290 [Candidatus Raymondbacteria bacterium RIFOXYD12_FULL_49_13]OGP43370.1 MAG: hypothetical protein A2324_02755 [Candidatus Raymondbacteria bacterium RIFOXYB2_FULL_49_35]